MKCTPLLLWRMWASSWWFVAISRSKNLKGNCAYGVFVQNSVFAHKNYVFHLLKQFSQFFIPEGLYGHLCISEGRHLVTIDGRKLYLCRWAFFKNKALTITKHISSFWPQTVVPTVTKARHIRVKLHFRHDSPLVKLCWLSPPTSWHPA